jgi:hypothetical protein
VTTQSLATELYAVSNRQPEIPVMKVLGYTEANMQGHPICIPLGHGDKDVPIRPFIWNQEKNGRLAFFATIEAAMSIRRRLQERTTDMAIDVVGKAEEMVRSAA